jgi:hypothetical protein
LAIGIHHRGWCGPIFRQPHKHLFFLVLNKVSQQELCRSGESLQSSDFSPAGLKDIGLWQPKPCNGRTKVTVIAAIDQYCGRVPRPILGIEHDLEVAATAAQ